MQLAEAKLSMRPIRAAHTTSKENLFLPHRSKQSKERFHMIKLSLIVSSIGIIGFIAALPFIAKLAADLFDESLYGLE